MAKRRTAEQIDADKIIKKQLNILAEKIYEESQKITRVRKRSKQYPSGGGTLKNSINFRVRPDTILTFVQRAYGKYVTPNNKPSNNKLTETDALLIKIKELIPEGVTIIKKELTESILFPFRKK